MTHNYKCFLMTALLSLWTTFMWAQTPKQSFTLDSDLSMASATNYRARNFIDLKKNFRFTASPGHTFSAVICDTLKFDIDHSVPNPLPGDTTNNNSYGKYIPGNTYGSNPIQTPQGLVTITRKVNGTINNADTSYVFPILWFKTVPLKNNLNGIYKWTDVTGNNASLLKYSSLGAGHGSEYQLTRDKVRTYNFNPAMDLSYEDVSKEILITKSNLAQTTVIGVWGAKEAFKADKFVFAINGRVNESVLFSKQSVVEVDSTKSTMAYGNDTTRNFLYRSNRIEGSDSTRFHERSLRVGTFYKANKPNTSVWGEPQKAVISLGNKFDPTNVNNTSKFKLDGQTFDVFKAFTPELLVFDRQLSPSESSKFETYLAIKYGLSLDRSYIASNGDVLWNFGSNQEYNNRITGYGREDAMGLNQRVATTSYEEKPYYTDLSVNDSYDLNDSYKLSSRNRLLVVGCEPANTMDNGKYVLFGDNKDSIITKAGVISGYDGGMSRNWKVCTNLYQQTETKKELTWRNSGLMIMNNTNFINTIFKFGNQSTAWAVTTDSLKGTDGYFAWNVEQEYGPITVKFGLGQEGLNPGDYGYKIATDGQVYSVQNGVVKTNSLFSVRKGQRIEIEKNGQFMNLRVDGVRYKNTEFVIDSIDIHKTYYGAVEIGINAFDIVLSKFQHGGFVDTGHKVELSYARSPGFFNYRNGKTYLIVDRLANGIVDAYPCDQVDTTRSKIIFNNVFWDTDGSGSDTFTFAYKGVPESKVKKIIDPENTEPEIEGTKEIKIYYADPHDLSTVTVKVQTSKPTTTIITMYDISGRRIFRQDLSESKEAQFTNIKLPTTGIYIIKVLNNEMKYSQKVISYK